MPVKTIPLVGSLINRNVNPTAFVSKDQIFRNCYPEVINNAVTGKAKAYLNKRPGSAASSALTGVLNGTTASCIWSSRTTPAAVLAFTNTSGTSTSVWTSGGTKIGGDIANTVTCVALTDTSISGTGNLVGFFTDSGGTLALEAWYFPEGGAWTQITDADFPPNLGTPEPLIGAPVFLNGRMYVMTTNGKVWNSDLNSLANWTASAFNTAQSYPEGGSGLARYKDLIGAFGVQSIELFQDSGLTPSPIISIGAVVNRIGAVRSGAPLPTICPVTNTVYFIGSSSETGQGGVYRLNGFTAEKVSTVAIDKILNVYPTTGIVGPFMMHGMSHLMLYSPTLISTDRYCYCIDTNTWWLLKLSGSLYPSSLIGFSGESYFNNPDDAKIYSVQPTAPVYQDGGSAYTQTIQFESMDMGTMNKKFWKRFKYIGDVQPSASTLTVSYSDDDYATFTTAGTIDLNSQSAMEQGLTRLGSSRRRSWKMEHAANTPNRGEAVEIEYDVGST